MTTLHNTIAAVATPSGTGAIATIRISGPRAIEITQKLWKGKDLTLLPSHTIHLGYMTGTDGKTIDQCTAAIFRAPRSFTGENTIELTCHGSQYIQQQILNSLTEAGAKPAGPGEFSQQAFLNGKIDLAQAEAITDVIAASSQAALRIANSQIKGTFSRKLNQLRDKLIEIKALIELELDFSEEDVTFANRQQLLRHCDITKQHIDTLAQSFKTGQAIKNGIRTVIAGIPNAGKSTLLNVLLQDDKAIVSDIPGTTRDIIEDTATINGLLFRFTDTAGLHSTTDKIENIGIQRAQKAIADADIVLWIFDPTAPLEPQTDRYRRTATALDSDATIIPLLNKTDTCSGDTAALPAGTIPISAKSGQGLETLRQHLYRTAAAGYDTEADIMVTNARHYDALIKARQSIERTIQSINAGQTADLTALEMRDAIHHIGSITGAVTTDTILATIFSRFCIGK